VGSAIWSIFREAASRGPSALADILVKLQTHKISLAWLEARDWKLCTLVIRYVDNCSWDDRLLSCSYNDVLKSASNKADVVDRSSWIRRVEVRRRSCRSSRKRGPWGCSVHCHNRICRLHTLQDNNKHFCNHSLHIAKTEFIYTCLNLKIT